MKNIHILSTKESVLGYRNGHHILRLDEPFTQGGNANPLHIYIINDEEIKAGEWCFEVHNGKSNAPIDTPKFTDDKGNTWWLRKANANDEAGCETTKKIVLSTDFKLIVDGVQSINFRFLEWYVDNPRDYIEVVKETFYKNKRGLQPFADETCKGKVTSYNIIMPKNELKTSAEWQALYKGLTVIDCDGWDRTNYQYSWFEELITLEEFKERRMRSTCYGFVEEPTKEAEDEIKPEDIWNPEKMEGIKKFIEAHKYNPKSFEAANQWYEPKKYSSAFPADRMSFMEGAKWQAEQLFSLEEVKNIATYAYNFFRRNDLSDDELDEEFETWLNKLNKQ